MHIFSQKLLKLIEYAQETCENLKEVRFDAFLAYEKIERRRTHTRHFQKSFQCQTMAQLDPSDRMRIIIEGKKREEQGNLSIRKLVIDLSISRKAVALWCDAPLGFNDILKVKHLKS